MRRAELQALFRHERASFARYAPDVARARLRIVADRCPGGGARCAARDLAYASWDDLEVVLAARALRLPYHNLVALVRHELGHLADPTPDRGGAEQRADDIAERVTGQRIRYDARDVQTVGAGSHPRPRHLHR